MRRKRQFSFNATWGRKCSLFHYMAIMCAAFYCANLIQRHGKALPACSLLIWSNHRSCLMLIHSNNRSHLVPQKEEEMICNLKTFHIRERIEAKLLFFLYLSSPWWVLWLLHVGQMQCCSFPVGGTMWTSKISTASVDLHLQSRGVRWCLWKAGVNP